MPETTTARHFARAAVTVAALEYDGTNGAALKRFLGSYFGVFNGKPAVLTAQGWQDIKPGERAILSPVSARPSIATSEEFAAEYAEAAHA